jgi:hypothetical protein
MSVGFDRARSLWLALAIIGGAGCSDARQPPQPASFDRPTDVAFVCLKDGELAEVADCDVERSDRALHALVTQSARGEVAAVNLATDRILDNRRDIPGYTFVPTGELPIAIAISPTKPELTYVASYGSRDVRVMRTKVLLGLSTEAGEVQEPISLTIGADGGSFGGTPSDMLLTPDESALIVTLSDVGKVARLPLVQCAEGDSECEPGVIDEGGITFVDLPTAVPATPTAVVTEDSYAKTCGEYQRPPLPIAPAPAEPLAAAAARPVAIAIDSACESCGDGRLLIADEALPLLHVLDLAALGAGTDPVLAPIPTGAPTRDVVVTPRVPTAFQSASEEMDEGAAPATYFVYAIDAVDGSVLVLENDALLAVNRDTGGRADRLPLQSRIGAPAPLAIALEVVTPQFRVGRSDYAQYVETYSSEADVVSSRSVCLDDAHTVVTPRRLRGVFLSAAMADGTVRIIDVHDMELRACRDCDRPVINPDNESLPHAPIVVRHHPRLVTDPVAVNEGDREELRPDTSAGVVVRTGRFGLRNNGTVASPLSPTFGCFSCAEGLEQALPDPEDQAEAASNADQAQEDGGALDELANICTEALVCGLSDPWAAAPTTYTASFEVGLPNTSSGDGRFVAPGEPGNVSGLLELHSTTEFCERGTLGRDDIAGARDAATCVPFETREVVDGEERYTPGSAPLLGDQIVILSEVLSDRALEALDRNPEERRICGEIRAKLDEEIRSTFAFEIIAAFEDRVAIRQQLEAPFNSGALRLDYQDLQKCIGGGLVRFFVRSQNGFIVQTVRDGFQHNVIANANGRCVVDAMSGPRYSRRTWTGCEYNDDRVQFVLDPFVAEKDDVVQKPGDGYGLIIQIGIGTTSSQLVMNAAQIGFGINALVPSRLRYSATDERLYMVDTYQGGLIPIDLDPFTDTPITSFY